MRSLPHATVASILFDGERFALVEELIDNRLVLNQPAGHIEPGEDPLQAAIRETLEETGLHFQPEFLVGIYSWCSANNGVCYLRFCFSGSYITDPAAKPLDDDISGVTWLNKAEIDARSSELRSPLVSRCVDDFLADQRYPLSVLRHLATPAATS
jgi:8-oxo-dGTP pyrophosphatase MutT (NUDIX family)